MVEQNLIEGINETLKLVLQKTDELNIKVEQLLAENQGLKLEIAKLKQPNQSKQLVKSIICLNCCETSNNTNDQPNNTKVLLVKQND